MVKEREVWLDLARIFAFFCVLICHSPATYDGLAGGRFFISAYNYYGVSGGPNLFFMISGALLFGKRIDYIPFLKKRLKRIVPPLLIWSTVYLLIDTFVYEKYTIPELLHKIVLVPFSPQIPAFWFLYSIIAIYLVTPILSSWLQKCTKIELQIVLLLWSISLFFPYLKYWDDEVLSAASVGYGWLYFFTGYIGYSLLGFVLKRHLNVKKHKRTCALLFLTAVLLPALLEYLLKLPHDAINHQRSFNVALMTISFFLMFLWFNDRLQRLSPNLKHKIKKISELSFGVYLTHLLFLPLVNRYIGSLHINYLIQIPLSALIAGTLSLICVYAISKLSISKFVIG